MLDILQAYFGPERQGCGPFDFGDNIPQAHAAERRRSREFQVDECVHT